MEKNERSIPSLGAPARSLEDHLGEAGPSHRQRLDPRIVRLWQTSGTIGCAAVLLGTVAWAIPMWLFVDAVPKPLIPVPILLALTIFWAAVIWYPPRRFSHWSFRLDGNILELRFGVVWRNSVQIPLSRLQHIDVRRGPLERHFGLASVEIYTAGTQNASHTIPGLPQDEAVALRDELVGHAESANR